MYTGGGSFYEFPVYGPIRPLFKVPNASKIRYYPRAYQENNLILIVKCVSVHLELPTTQGEP